MEYQSHRVSMKPEKFILNKRERKNMKKVFTSGVGLPDAEHFNDTAGPG